MRTLVLIIKYIIVGIVLSPSLSHTPYTVHTTLRGKKYTLSNVSTVKEVQQSLQEQSGEATSNIILLFGGQKLKSNDILEDIGVEDGSTMNAIVSTKKKKKSSSVSPSMDEGGSSEGNGSSSSSASVPSMEELMKQSGLDPNVMQNLFSQAGGANGEGGGGPNLEQSMKMMQEMINTPYFQEFLNDPSKMEESRQLLLQNPMMKSMIESIPFMKDIIGDKDKFRETMISAAQMYKEMGSSEDGSMMAEAMQRMNGLFGTNNAAASGMPFGLDINGIMDKTQNVNNNLALDELSEDDVDDD